MWLKFNYVASLFCLDRTQPARVITRSTDNEKNADNLTITSLENNSLIYLCSKKKMIKNRQLSALKVIRFTELSIYAVAFEFTENFNKFSIFTNVVVDKEIAKRNSRGRTWKIAW